MITIPSKLKQVTLAVCVPLLACAVLLLIFLSATILEQKLADGLLTAHTTVTHHINTALSSVNPQHDDRSQDSPDRGLSTEEHLMMAAKSGNLDVVKRAIITRMQVHNAHRHAAIDMALYYAAEFDRLPVVSFLLSREGVDPNEGHHEDGHTVLTIASKKGHTDIVQLLLLTRGSSINLNLTAQLGKTALIWAAINGRTEIVQLLASLKRCNLEIRDTHYKRTALMWAATNHHTEVVQVLLRAGANPHTTGAVNPFLKVQHRSQPHVSALHLAKHYSHYAAVVHLENHMKARTFIVPESDEHATSLDELRARHPRRDRDEEEL